jgi:hypothetical protein
VLNGVEIGNSLAADHAVAPGRAICELSGVALADCQADGQDQGFGSATRPRGSDWGIAIAGHGGWCVAVRNGQGVTSDVPVLESDNYMRYALGVTTTFSILSRLDRTVVICKT